MSRSKKYMPTQPSDRPLLPLTPLPPIPTKKEQKKAARKKRQAITNSNKFSRRLRETIAENKGGKKTKTAKNKKSWFL